MRTIPEILHDLVEGCSMHPDKRTELHEDISELERAHRDDVSRETSPTAAAGSGGEDPAATAGGADVSRETLAGPASTEGISSLEPGQ